MHLFHFFMGLFWLAVITAVIFLYLFFPYFLYLLFRWYRALRRERKAVRLEWTREAGSFIRSVRRSFSALGRTFGDFGQSLRKSLDMAAEQDDAWPPPFVRPVDRKRIFAIALFTVCVCLTVYVQQRLRWMGAGSVHLEAKEYFVSGQVLNTFRHLETRRRHPDAEDLLLLARLQKMIYRQGVQYLPANDGEIGVWQCIWFHSHYYKKGRKQVGLRAWETSPYMRHLLDQWWEALEIIGTRPIADKRMLEEHALRDYSTLAFWYMVYVGHYSHDRIGAAQRLAKDAKHVERFRRLSEWLWHLSEKWRASPTVLQFNAVHPKIQVLRQSATLLALKALIRGEIHQRKFDCANVSVRRYIDMRQEFACPSSSLPAYRIMDEKEQAEIFYDLVINGVGAISTKYIIHKYCDIEVAGQESLEEYSNKFELQNSARSIYSDEIKIIEEKYHGK